MSVTIIAKAGLFTLLLCGIMAGFAYFAQNVNYFIYSGIIVIVFLLMLDLFEREAKRLGRKI